MELVVDANIILASLFKSAVTRELLLDSRLKLCAPEHLILEVRRLLDHNISIQKRMGLSGKSLEEAFYFLTQNIETYPRKVYTPLLKQACLIAPHDQDAPYLALSLLLNIPIWSNDKGLKAQTKVKVYSTIELLALLDKRFEK